MRKKVITYGDKLKTIEHLYSNFEHRMDFFWKSYYRLLLYHLAIPTVPFFAIKYIEIDPKNEVLISGLLVMAIVITFIGILVLPSTVKYLIGEDNRVIMIHNRYKDMLGKISINLNLEDAKNIKTGTIMMKKFYRLILLFSLVVALLESTLFFTKYHSVMVFDKIGFLSIAISIPVSVPLIWIFIDSIFKFSMRYKENDN